MMGDFMVSGMTEKSGFVAVSRSFSEVEFFVVSNVSQSFMKNHQKFTKYFVYLIFSFSNPCVAAMALWGLAPWALTA